MSMDEMTVVDELQEWLRKYYHEDILELAQRYPNEQRWLEIQWSDLLRFDPDFADDFLENPETQEQMEGYIKDALYRYDIPIDIELDPVDIRVVGLNDEDIYKPLEITKEEPEGYIGVSGDLHKVTTPNPEIQVAAFECQVPGCGHQVKVEVFGEEVDAPHKCDGCGTQASYQFDKRESEFEQYSKIRIQTPPDESGEMQSEHIDGEVRGDLVWYGHDVGLIGRSGDSVTVYGTVEYKQRQGRKANELLFDEYIDVQAIEFESDDDNIDIPAYRDEFTQLAERDDVIELWKEDLVPELYATDEWDTALELLIAYLFASPRIDIHEGPTFRGDIHALIISDYGMGKSMVNSAVALFSPSCIKESVTGMSSDVALLAAAVEDDFGEGQWTLQPGILVRGNGGHVILDEIDKTDADLERMNNALEGEQMVDVNKAGQQATYKSRVGLLATGNPEDSRFDPNLPISDQLDLDQSLLSRFDGIVTMEDKADEEQDAHVAEAQGLSYVEAHEKQYGDRDELDRLDRTITPDIGKNWIAYARQEIHPRPTRDQIQDIKDWYATEVRQLNKDFARNEGDGADMPVPVSARVVANTIRFSVAFARVNLRERVAGEDIDRAKGLSKALVGQNFDGEKFVPEEARNSSDKWGQLEPKLIDELEDSAMVADELARSVNESEQRVRDCLDNMAKRKGSVICEKGKWKLID